MSLLDECWVWHGYKLKGYGAKKFRGVFQTLHRVSWAWANGKFVDGVPQIPKGMVVMHECDMPACVNPRHLRLGSYADNSADMVKKGRGNHVLAQRYRSRTHCMNGHELNLENTDIRSDGGRRCKICRRAYTRSRDRKIREGTWNVQS